MMAMGKSPHVRYDPSEISTHARRRRRPRSGEGRGRQDAQPVPRLPDLPRARWAATRARAMLFEGPPGTGKTYMAKAMAHEAGVPFLFVSSTAFQSMYYGADRPQDPQLLQGAAQGRAPKRAARSASSRRSTPSPAPAAACAPTPLPARSAPTRTVARSTQQLERRHLRRRQRAADPAAVVRHADGGGRMLAAGGSTASNRLLPAHRRMHEEAARCRRTSW